MIASAELSVLIIELEQDRLEAHTINKWIFTGVISKLSRSRDIIKKNEKPIRDAVRILAELNQIEAH